MFGTAAHISHNNEKDGTQQFTTTTKIQFVLCKKLANVAHVTAHALHCKFQVSQALQRYNQQNLPEEETHRHSRQIPVPHVLASYCSNMQVLGAEFYIMEYGPGHIFHNPILPDIMDNQD
ncbi:hypothetical protein ACA910_000048 [Epithemia clementina (nom. ined.)]